MANTTFTGPVRSENGFESVTKAAQTGVVTKHADLHSATGGNSVVADAAKEAGALLLNSIATTGLVMKTYQATVTVANGGTTGDEAIIGFPSNFIPMFCVIRNNSVTTSGGNITDVGTAGDPNAYVDGAVLATSAVTSQIFACNGVAGIGSGGSGTTAGIPLTPDEIRVTMADPGLSGASITVTFVGFTFTETLDLA
jgi:hypothetical protein